MLLQGTVRPRGLGSRSPSVAMGMHTDYCRNEVSHFLILFVSLIESAVRGQMKHSEETQQGFDLDQTLCTTNT